MPTKDPIEGRCNANLPNGYCARHPIKDRKRCRKHGGERHLTFSGMDNPNFKGGRYSKFLKESRIGAAYSESVKDADALLDLSEVLAIFDAAVKLSAERVVERDTPQFRERVRDLWQNINDSRAEGDEPRTKRLSEKLDKLIERGCGETDAVKELTRAADQLARRVEAAWSIKLNKQNSINAGDLLRILGQVMGIVMEAAPEEELGRTIVRRIRSQVVKRIENDSVENKK